MSDADQTIGFIGGTGPAGRGLAVRFALAGRRVVLGSRESARAEASAASLQEMLNRRSGAGSISGNTNAATAREADIVFLTVPFAAQASLLAEIGDSLDGKIAVTVIAPIKFANGRARSLPPSSGSAAEEARKQVPAARWVAGFHTLPARDLLDPKRPLDSDALICSDDADAKREVLRLAELIDGIRAVDAGALESARYLEGAVALLININRIYRTRGSIKIVGI